MLIACGTACSITARSATLPAGPGKDAVEAGCATCHSLSYIPTNSRFPTQQQWRAEVVKMRAAFGAPIDDTSADAIVAYLTANFAAQKNDRQVEEKMRWLYQPGETCWQCLEEVC